MILLAGIPSEPPIALAVASAEALGLPCLVLNQRAFAFDDLDLRFAEGQCSGSLRVAGQRYPLSRFTGIYLRTMDADSLPELQAASEWSAGATEARVRAFAEQNGLKLGKAAQPLRAALTGKSTSPGVFDVLEVLGRDESLARIEDQID